MLASQPGEVPRSQKGRDTLEMAEKKGGWMGFFGCFFWLTFFENPTYLFVCFFHQTDFHMVLVGKVDVFAMDMVKIIMLRLRRLLCKVVGRVEIHAPS